ncbi:MAG: hypothetical protein ACPGQL_01340 [Thermoplasmatota archaeon]
MSGGHLQRFIADARARVADGFYHTDGPALLSNGNLKAAIQAAPDGRAILAELKPRSPSEGRLLQGPAEPILAAYKDGGATGLSLLTDGDHFDGSPALLRAGHATGLPTLMKDFVVDEVQLDCAAHHGASAVLLIERCFPTPDERESLVEAAHARGLEVLLEVHSPKEWERAASSAADIIGVNSRDLDTLDVDVAGAREVVKAAAQAGHTTLALSGVRTRHDAAAAKNDGAAGVLVGTSLLRSPDAALAVRALRRPLVKLCGLRTEADVAVAATAGADFAGLVVGAARSPRNLRPIDAQRLADVARAAGLRTVLVTPHTDAWEVREWCRLVRPDFVQLHGLETTEEWEHSLKVIPTRIWHAVAPDTEAPMGGIALVIDTPKADGSTGGSGRTHDWAQTARLVKNERRWTFVAGGLGPENVQAALVATGATGADVSGGIESPDGTKDPEKMRRFVEAARHG